MMTTVSLPPPVRTAPRGTTLLEVLVAGGVLVVGLASIASLLPAAGSRLGQAANEDRGGTLAANARSEALARGLVAFDLFAAADKPIAFGKGMLTGTTLNAGLSAAGFAAPVAAVLNQRIDQERGFLLEDEVLFIPTTNAATPINDFPGGRRAFREGISWGATLVPNTFPAEAGSSAVLGIAVFHRLGQAQSVPLTTMAGGLFKMTTLNEATLKQFLKSCSYVLVPRAGGGGPRWFRIMASWRPLPDPATGVRTNDGCFITFADPEFADFAGADPTVIGFENLIRVDQYNVTLE